MAMRRFAPGAQARVLDLGKPGHVRIPHYVRGHVGTVVQYCGSYLNPEQLAIGITQGPAIDLYRVAFDLQGLWAGSGAGRCDAMPGDRLVIEIYDHWLEPVAATNSSSTGRASDGL